MVTALAGIATLRAKGVGWKRIAAEMGVGIGTTYSVALGSKTPEKVPLIPAVRQRFVDLPQAAT